MAEDYLPVLLVGSTGPDVNSWQAILGIPETGDFDVETEQATMDFQTAHGLTSDGVVGSDTWAAGETVFGKDAGVTATSRGTAKPADANAYKVATRAGKNLTEAERQYVLAVARGEGYYGLGWKAGQGAGSHNWGAVQGTGPGGSFPHLDHDSKGKPYTGHFKIYNTDDEGFLDMAKILLKPNVKAALNSDGSLRKAVFAQHSNGYFELDPNKYLSAVVKNYGALSASGLFKPVLSEEGKGTSVLALTAAALLALGGARYAYKKLGKRG